MRTKDLTGNPQVLGVVVDVMKKTGVTEIQVSSLWRNSEGSPHKEGLGIDITAATRDGVTVRFNNVNGEPSTAAKALRDEVYNSMVNDPRVSQALDPWNLYREPGGSVIGNNWQGIVSQKGKTVSEINSMTLEQIKDFRETLSRREKLHFDHRHHLHITIYYY